MAYTVLARRFRSQTFDDVVGQDAVAQTLKSAIKTGRVAHAYLFTGTRGVGKTTMARILAKALNCLSVDEPTPQPCCKCDSCLAINAGEDIDVMEIDGASNNGVDNIRQLRQNAIYRPARARYKIYIIDEVHMLSSGAFNALLKILEEPPEHVKFIFATTEPNKVLPTIQSRCQRFDFGGINPVLIVGQLEKILKNEGIKYENDLVLKLARLADGSMRDALSLLDQLISTGGPILTLRLLEEFLGEPERERLLALTACIADKDAAAVLSIIDELIRAAQTPVQLAEALIVMMRDIMVLKTAGAKSDLLVLTEQEKQSLSILADKFDTPALIYGITALEKLHWTIKNSQSPRALLEASLLRLALSEHFMGLDEAMARISNAPTASARQTDQNTIKKKIIEDSCSPLSAVPAVHEKTQAAPEEPVAPAPAVSENHLPAWGELESIKADWKRILKEIAAEDEGTAGFLEVAEPTDCTENTLTLTFPQSAGFAMMSCQSRAQKISVWLSRSAGKNISLKFKTGTDMPEKPLPRPAGAKIASGQREKILSDPAVRLILTGLDANVTVIEEAKESEEPGLHGQS